VIKQVLHEHAAQRVADQDRLLRQGADDFLEVLDDSALRQIGEFRTRRAAQFGGRASVEGQSGAITV
jgi:hypothetical protein